MSLLLLHAMAEPPLDKCAFCGISMTYVNTVCKLLDF